MYRFIQAQSQTYPVQVLCQTLEVSRSGYYEWLKPVPTSNGSKPRPTGGEKASNAAQIKELIYVCIVGDMVRATGRRDERPGY